MKPTDKISPEQLKALLTWRTMEQIEEILTWPNYQDFLKQPCLTPHLDKIDTQADDTQLLVDALRGYPGFAESATSPPVPMPDWWPRTRVPCLTPYMEMWDEEQAKKAKLKGAGKE